VKEIDDNIKLRYYKYVIGSNLQDQEYIYVIGWVQVDDGLSWLISDNSNMKKHQYVNLDGLFKVLLQWIWNIYKQKFQK